MLTAPTFVQEQKLKRSAWWALLSLAAFVAVVAGLPRRSRQPLSLAHNGVHGLFTLHNKWHQLLLYNFRAGRTELHLSRQRLSENSIKIVGGQHIARRGRPRR